MLVNGLPADAGYAIDGEDDRASGLADDHQVHRTNPDPRVLTGLSQLVRIEPTSPLPPKHRSSGPFQTKSSSGKIRRWPWW